MENNSAVALFFPSFLYKVCFLFSLLWFMGELILLGSCLVCDTQHPEFHWWPIPSPCRNFQFLFYIGSSEFLVQVLVFILFTQSTLHIGKHSSTAGHNVYSELSCNVIFKCSVRRKKINISEINFFYIINIYISALKTPQKEQNISKDSTLWKLMSTLNVQVDGFFL